MIADAAAPALESRAGETATERLPAARWLGLDWFEWGCLAVLSALSMSVLGPLLLKGRMLTGADGLFPPDQLQYLTWIRETSAHWLIGNRFDLRPDHRVFLHPGFLISGLVHRWTGASLGVSFLVVWKPAAVLVTFIGCLKYTRRLLWQRWPARVGLVLSLFVVIPWSAVAKSTGWGGSLGQYRLDFISGEMATLQGLLGYMMTAVAVFTMPLVLLGVEKARAGGRPWLLTAAALGGAWVMWLQPWQGGELMLIIVGVELWRRWRSEIDLAWRLLPVLAVTALPAIYYAILSSTDQSWKLAGKANQAGAQAHWSWPWWMVVISFAPLAIPAAMGLWKRAESWQDVAVRMWPVAVLVVFFAPFGTFPYHAVQGVVLPLAVLAVQGFTSNRPRLAPRARWWWVIPVLAVLIIPGTAHKLQLVRNNIHNVAYPYYIFDGEERALNWLQSNPSSGGVLASSYGGLLVAPFAGREVYLGPFSWTPSWDLRARVAGVFFAGRLDPGAARRFVRSTGTRFVFQECLGRVQPPISLRRELGPLIASTHNFGCARVYVLKASRRSDRLSSRIGGVDG